MWNAKYTLRSHFDGVRALAFHPTEPVLITASEDHTLKLWNLQKTVPAKKYVFQQLFQQVINNFLLQVSLSGRGTSVYI